MLRDVRLIWENILIFSHFRDCPWNFPSTMHHNIPPFHLVRKTCMAIKWKKTSPKSLGPMLCLTYDVWVSISRRLFLYKEAFHYVLFLLFWLLFYSVQWLITQNVFQLFDSRIWNRLGKGGFWFRVQPNKTCSQRVFFVYLYDDAGARGCSKHCKRLHIQVTYYVAKGLLRWSRCYFWYFSWLCYYRLPLIFCQNKIQRRYCLQCCSYLAEV